MDFEKVTFKLRSEGDFCVKSVRKRLQKAGPAHAKALWWRGCDTGTKRRPSCRRGL